MVQSNADASLRKTLNPSCSQLSRQVITSAVKVSETTDVSVFVRVSGYVLIINVSTKSNPITVETWNKLSMGGCYCRWYQRHTKAIRVHPLTTVNISVIEGM